MALYKNNALITRTSTSEVRYNTRNRTTSQYGKYKCLSDIKLAVIEKVILLQEEGIGITIEKMKSISIDNEQLLILFSLPNSKITDCLST